MNLPEAASAQPALTIVVPVYKSADTIAILVEQLSALCPVGGMEIILVNDGSPDGTGDVCRKLLETTSVPLTLVEHARNFGEHNAVMTGLRLARGAFVITMDDDLQNSPQAAMMLFDCARAGNWDVVFSRYPVKQHEAWRNAGSRFTNAVANLLLPKPKGLYLSSFRCMSSFVAREIAAYHGPFPYVDGLIVQVAGKLTTLEVPHEARTSGRSTYTLSKLINLWLNMASGFSIAPLRLATIAGMALLGAGLLWTLALLINAIANDQQATSSSALTAIVLLVAGMQCMTLGLIGEYVGRILLTASGKPQAVIRSIQRSRAN
jgi:undecaprenyl-phosphate 4-deoxy-4-formamido-L-arabinose transferase